MKAETIHAATSHAEAKADLFDGGNLDRENPHVRSLQRIARCRALLAQVNGILSVLQQYPSPVDLADIEQSLKTIVEDYKQ